MRNELGAVVVLAAFAACGDNVATSGPDAAIAIDAAPAIDAPAGFTEAAHPSQPTVMNAGGTVLATPKVVPVFFAGDGSAQATIEDFLAQMAASPYWTAISAEYGVGALTIAPSVIATEAPPTTDTDLQALIAAHAAGSGSGAWPVNDANTIYTVFLPAGVTETAGGGTSCQAFGGYHDEITGSGSIVYALVPRCVSQTFPGLQEVTIATSHEILEAATDPRPESAPAFNTTDDEDAIWQLVPGGELGDMCETARAAYQPLVGSYMVQRTWSNASAAAGHDPCVPALTTPYVEAVANLPDITVSAGGQSLVTRGVQVPLNMSKTIEVDLYSDAAAADFTVEAVDAALLRGGSAAELGFTFDKTTGKNGDKLQLTVTRKKAAAQFGISELALITKVNGVSVGTWWALVTQ